MVKNTLKNQSGLERAFNVSLYRLIKSIKQAQNKFTTERTATMYDYVGNSFSVLDFLSIFERFKEKFKHKFNFHHF